MLEIKLKFVQVTQTCPIASWIQTCDHLLLCLYLRFPTRNSPAPSLVVARSTVQLHSIQDRGHHDSPSPPPGVGKNFTPSHGEAVIQTLPNVSTLSQELGSACLHSSTHAIGLHKKKVAHYKKDLHIFPDF